MKVLKFGGTSVGSAERIKEVGELVTRPGRKIVVLSAMSGTTNSLVEIANYLYKKNFDGANEVVNRLERNYLKAVENLFAKEEFKHKGLELVKSYQKNVILATIDEAWKDHLRELDDLKQAVQNASYEQKDPLLIYKFESFNLFKSMIESNNRKVVSSLAKAHIPIKDSSGVKEANEQRQSQDMGRLKTRKDELPGSGIPGGASGQGGGETATAQKEKQKAEPIRSEKKVGRNEPCPCGSGKKYKHCHGK